jgi:hypothetical protein
MLNFHRILLQINGDRTEIAFKKPESDKKKLKFVGIVNIVSISATMELKNIAAF